MNMYFIFFERKSTFKALIFSECGGGNDSMDTASRSVTKSMTFTIS